MVVKVVFIYADVMEHTAMESSLGSLFFLYTNISGVIVTMDHS